MLGIYASFALKDGVKEEAIAAVQDMIAKTRQEAGNISYRLFAPTDSENTLVFIEEWQDQASIDSHSASDHFNAGVAALGELTTTPPVIQILAPVE